MADKEGWDLNAVVEAVVRGCPARTTAAENENPLSCLSSLTFEDDDSQDPFGLGLHTQAPSDELQEVYKPFYNANTSAPPPNPGSAAFNNVQFSSNPAMVDVPTTPQFNPGSSSTAVAVPAIEARRQAHPPLPQPQMAVYPQVSAQAVPPLLPPPPMQAPNTRRARKRKNQQQQKSVCHLSADNLSSDPWAWRKYGQKPIKGSPYPRNYYRCSSSKGCSARKQVEKSTTDPEMFVVTYTGEHNHTRPTHRNSLAGSTRNKFAASSSLEKPDGLVGSSPAATGCSSSAKNQRQLSPRTPLTAPIEEDAANFHGSDKDLLNDVEAATMGSEKTGSEDNVATGDSTNDDDEVEGEDDEEEDEDEDDLLIPNMAMSEEIFMGFRELGHCPGSADSWGPARADLPRSSSSSSGAGRS